MVERLTNAQARRIALAAQGFAEPRPTGRIDRRHLRRVVQRMGVIQIDSVNVLVRSQELSLFARLGPHPRSLITDATAAGELFEYWVHEASHVPTAHYHLYSWHMTGEHKWAHVSDLRGRRPGFVEEVYQRVALDGPLTSADLAERVGKKGTWWDWDDGKIALEHLFWTGQVTARRRSTDFARMYDLTERVIPADVLARPALPEREARKELLVLAAKHHGIGTFEDLTDYHRQRNPPCRDLVRELVEAGRLIPVTVDGWDRQAYLHPLAATPRRVDAAALLSPFDPLVWRRERTERLFEFRYRIEIYVPQHKREHGYYVLPFLMGDQLVARVDLKADRQRRVLMVPGAFAEAGTERSDGGVVAEALAAELEAMATWLGLDSIEVGERGNLVAPLQHAVHHYART